MIRLGTVRLGVLLALLASLILQASFTASARESGEWTATSDMVYGPRSHAAALLTDGRVLIAGGYTIANSVVTCSLTDAQLFDPATSTWAATGRMATGRSLHTATTLDDGRVLVAGGVDCTFYISVVYASAEIFDPTTGTWAAITSMSTARYGHTATLLNNGRVLVAGGSTGGSALGGAEIFDPATGSWESTSSMVTPRRFHEATLLNDGRVLVAGGSDATGHLLSNAEIFDPATGSWAATSSMVTPRRNHTATTLNDGRVLVAGGADAGGSLSSAEIFDPATGHWAAAGSLGTARTFHTATRLSDGRILAAGGHNNGDVLSSAEIFDPATGSWAAISSMINNRKEHTATRLSDGRILAVGGEGNGGCCAELLTLTDGGGTPPTPTPTPTVTPTPTSGSTPTPTPSPAESITVVTPNGGEVWQIGSTQTIQWSSQGITGNVKIQLSRDGGASYKQIANNVPNTGAFQWKVTKPATTQALIRVISIDQPTLQDTSDGIFSITQ